MEVGRQGEAGLPAPEQPRDSRTVTVACLRCREQKLRCDRELPSCIRCYKQQAACIYPLPPDRKRIAQNRRKTSRSRASLSNGEEHVYRSEPSAAVKSNSEETESAELPSPEVGLLLLEVYFKRIYNATLLFHKSIAFHLYMQNDIPDYLLRAIFAQAAIFLKQVESPYEGYIKVMPEHKLFENSWSWARSASQEVLSYADEPTILRIQTLQVLQLYYFSQGEIHRAIVHASLAYQLSQLVGYDRLYENVASPSTNRTMQFDREMRRRCFWASWCSFCIGSAQLDSSGACERVMGLPLPAKFEKRGWVKGAEFKLGQKMEVDWKLSIDPVSNHGIADSSSFSLMAEVVKLLGMWTKVQAFISDSPMLSNSQQTDQLNKLVELLNPIKRSIQLPLTDICSRAEFYGESPELLTSVGSMYYLSRLLMHASMVPILSGRPFAESPAAGEFVRKNVEIFLQQATEFTELLQQFIARDLDITMLWPFSGHAAFVAGGVLVHDAVGHICGPIRPGRWVDFSGNEDYSDGIGSFEYLLEAIAEIGRSRYCPETHSQLPFLALSMIILEAKIEKAIKLNEAVDSSRSNNTTSITPTLPNETVLGITLAGFNISTNA